MIFDDSTAAIDAVTEKARAQENLGRGHNQDQGHDASSPTAMSSLMHADEIHRPGRRQDRRARDTRRVVGSRMLNTRDFRSRKLDPLGAGPGSIADARMQRKVVEARNLTRAILAEADESRATTPRKRRANLGTPDRRDLRLFRTRVYASLLRVSETHRVLLFGSQRRFTDVIAQRSRRRTRGVIDNHHRRGGGAISIAPRDAADRDLLRA